MTGYGTALALTLGVEVPIVAALFPGRRARLAVACAAATSLTHAAMHFGFPRAFPVGASSVVIGELFATVFEGAIYAAASASVGRAAVASALANSASYVLGLLVLGGSSAG